VAAMVYINGINMLIYFSIPQATTFFSILAHFKSIQHGFVDHFEFCYVLVLMNFIL